MTRAPGPKGSLIWGSLPAFKADALGFLSQAFRDHGDIVRLRFGPITAHLINHPDHIAQVLSRNGTGYDKATRSASRIAATTGDSLLSANQPAWARHRRLIQPAFQPGCFAGIGPVVDSLLEPMLDRWQKAGTIDIVDEMMQLVIRAAVRILFSSDIDPQRISTALEILLADTWRRIEAPLDASILSPRFHRRDFTAALARIDAIVLDLVQQRRAMAQRPDDVLSRLLAAHEGHGEAPLGDTELRDAAVTLLLAGHETTANALSWAFIHCASGPVTGDAAQIFAEAVRLHPSIWVIERRAVHGDRIGGYDIPRGSSVLISPYILHRRPDFWPNPQAFDPSRFAGDAPRLRDGYLPYGLGQHRCIGLHLANAMAVRIIDRVLARFSLTLLPGQSLAPVPGITLRHHGPVQLKAQVRAPMVAQPGPVTNR